MLKLMMSSVLIIALAGCAAQDGARNASIAESDVRSEAGYNPLPGGLPLPPTYHLREDRFYVTKRKAHLYRRVTLEVLDREQGQAIEDIERLMHIRGYRVSGDPTGSRVETELKFKKKKNPTIIVEFRPDVGEKPAHPLARHLVVFKWKIADGLDNWLLEPTTDEAAVR